jgi:hypothetical protein
MPVESGKTTTSRNGTNGFNGVVGEEKSTIPGNWSNITEPGTQNPGHAKEPTCTGH